MGFRMTDAPFPRTSPNVPRHRCLWPSTSRPKRFELLLPERFPTQLDAVCSSTCCMTVVRTESQRARVLRSKSKKCLYPLRKLSLERAKGIEPSYAAWEGAATSHYHCSSFACREGVPALHSP